MPENNDFTQYSDLNGEPITSATKRRILDTAVELFAQRGFSGASVRDITKLVGIKESSLYKHFTSKESILEMLFIHFRREFAKIIPPLEHLDWILANMTPQAFLERGVQNFKEHFADPVNRQLWRIVCIEKYRVPLARDIYFGDIVGNTTEFIALVFAKWITAGKIRSFDPRTMAVSYQYPLFTMITELVALHSEGKDTVPIERRMTDHVAFFCKVIVI